MITDLKINPLRGHEKSLRQDKEYPHYKKYFRSVGNFDSPDQTVSIRWLTTENIFCSSYCLFWFLQMVNHKMVCQFKNQSNCKQKDRMLTKQIGFTTGFGYYQSPFRSGGIHRRIGEISHHIHQHFRHHHQRGHHHHKVQNK